jgi:hypothetical protein
MSIIKLHLEAISTAPTLVMVFVNTLRLSRVMTMKLNQRKTFCGNKTAKDLSKIKRHTAVMSFLRAQIPKQVYGLEVCVGNKQKQSFAHVC